MKPDAARTYSLTAAGYFDAVVVVTVARWASWRTLPGRIPRISVAAAAKVRPMPAGMLSRVAGALGAPSTSASERV